MRILVTGAGGYIGRHVVKMLLDLEQEVIASGRDLSAVDSRTLKIEADILTGERKDWYSFFQKPDACIHLAWRDGFIHNSPLHIEDISNHFIFLRSLIDVGIKKLAVIGSMHELGFCIGEVDAITPCNPCTLYGVAKNTLRKSIFLYAKDKNCVVQWLRAFYIYGDDLNNHSIFTKLLEADKSGYTVFPFTSGKNIYDFIEIKELALQIAACILYDEYGGIINCCSGKPIKLSQMVEDYIRKNKLSLKLDYGAYPERKYDSPAMWGNTDRIEKIKELLRCGED